LNPLKLNRCLDKLIPITTPLAVALGLFLPDVFINLRPLVILLFGIMTFSGALKLTASEIGSTVKSPVPILLFFFTSHVIMPLAALFSSSLIFTDTDVVAGFVLLFAGPTAVSGFIWVTIFKGDKALALSLILLDTLLAPLVVPATVSVLMGAKIAMDMSGIAFSLLLMVVVPTIIGVMLNETSRGKIPQVICPALDPAAKICLMLVIAANSSVVAPNIKFNDPLVWGIALLCIVLTSSGFLLARLNGIACRRGVAKVTDGAKVPCDAKASGAEKSASLVIAGGLRNNSAVMTIAVTFFPEAAVFPAILSIVFQQMIAAVMGKVLIRSGE